LEDTISENELEVKTLRAKKDEIQSEVESVGAEKDVLEDLLSTATDLNTKETQLQAAKQAAEQLETTVGSLENELSGLTDRWRRRNLNRRWRMTSTPSYRTVTMKWCLRLMAWP